MARTSLSEVKALDSTLVSAAVLHLRAHAAGEDEIREVQAQLTRLGAPAVKAAVAQKARMTLSAYVAARAKRPGWGELAATLQRLGAVLPAPPPPSPPPPPPRPPAATKPAAAPPGRRAVAGPLFLVMDEYFPVSHDPARVGEGVIAGFALDGGPSVTAGWPVVRNHLANASAAAHEKAVRRVFETDRVVPFVIPVSLRAGSAQKEFWAISDAAVLVALGWILAPREGVASVPVHLVFGEHGGRRAGDSATDRFRGLVEGVAIVSPERFGRWDVREARYASGGDYLVAYADAVADLAHAHNPAMVALAKDLRLADAPGHFGLSLELLPTLLRLEQMERAGNVGDILALAREIHGSALLAGVLRDLRARVAANGALRAALLAAVNTEFDRADLGARDLRALESVTEALVEVRADDPASVRALRAALRVQRANHDGSPERIAAEVDAMTALVRETARTAPAASLLLSLHLAVHLHDRMRFREARALLSAWVEEGRDLGLPPHARGWIRSSLGQSLAYLGEHEGAARCFDEALACLRDATTEPAQRARDLDQTGCYRALNALCVDPAGAEARVSEYLGDLVMAAGELAADASPASRYRHHLLVRWMHDSEHHGPVWEAYRARQGAWAAGEGYPWPLTAMYRALLRYRVGACSAEETHAACWEAAERESRGGATARLIAAGVRAAACAVGGAEERRAAVARELDALAGALPDARGCVEGLRAALELRGDVGVRAALGALPFNFR